MRLRVHMHAPVGMHTEGRVFALATGTAAAKAERPLNLNLNLLTS